MNAPFSPHDLIGQSVIRTLHDAAAAAESAGALTDEQLHIILEQGWFRMFLPRSMGGLNLSLTEGLHLQESLAWIDGSLGWTVTLCSGATMFAGYLEPGIAATLLADPAACFGGSGQVSGIAAMTGSGYRVSGRWQYATGAPHLTVFTANFTIGEAGQALLDAAGEPVVRSFFFLRNEVEVSEDWHTMGLKATAGHAFEVKELDVPAGRAFTISPEAAQIDQPVFHYPFLPFAEATLAVNTSGMTLHFLDICEQMFAHRGSSRKYTDDTIAMLNGLLIRCKGEVAQFRANFYQSVAHSWEPVLQHGVVRPDILHAVGISSRTMVKGCRQIVQELYPYCGMAAADPRSELNRVWRDVFTASQHTLLTYPAALTE